MASLFKLCQTRDADILFAQLVYLAGVWQTSGCLRESIFLQKASLHPLFSVYLVSISDSIT